MLNNPSEQFSEWISDSKVARSSLVLFSGILQFFSSFVRPHIEQTPQNSNLNSMNPLIVRYSIAHNMWWQYTSFFSWIQCLFRAAAYQQIRKFRTGDKYSHSVMLTICWGYTANTTSGILYGGWWWFPCFAHTVT